jgi:hypothetical protein
MKEGGMKQPVTELERPAIETARARPAVRTRTSVVMPPVDARRLLIDGIDGGRYRGDPIDPGHGDIVAAGQRTGTPHDQPWEGHLVARMRRPLLCARVSAWL